MEVLGRNVPVSQRSTVKSGARSSPPPDNGGSAPRPAGDDRRQRLWSACRIGILAIAGGLPVLAISAHVFGLLAIDIAARYLVLPVSLVALVIAWRRSPEATLARRGMLAGLVAVTVYDGTRLPFILSGIWPDFIPRVGGWVVGGDEPSAVLGYLWRYIGDGGGMALFFVLACAVIGVRRHLVAVGVGFGIFVWSGLMGTVALAESGEQLLFPITALSFTMSLVGHLVYGSVLGWIYARMIRRNPELTRLPAAELPVVAWLHRAARRVVPVS